MDVTALVPNDVADAARSFRASGARSRAALRKRSGTTETEVIQSHRCRVRQTCARAVHAGIGIPPASTDDPPVVVRRCRTRPLPDVAAQVLHSPTCVAQGVASNPAAPQIGRLGPAKLACWWHISPRVLACFVSASGRPLPLLLGRETLSGNLAVGRRLDPRHAGHRMLGCGWITPGSEHRIARSDLLVTALPLAHARRVGLGGDLRHVHAERTNRYRLGVRVARLERTPRNPAAAGQASNSPLSTSGTNRRRSSSQVIVVVGSLPSTCGSEGRPRRRRTTSHQGVVPEPQCKPASGASGHAGALERGD